MSDEEKEFFCSFCGKSQHDVRKLIAGPTAFICDECVVLCIGILIPKPKIDNVAPIKIECGDD